MTLIILTLENLHVVKGELRIALPQIASSHLTEAIAAGLGFRTHAALRAQVAADAGRLSNLATGCSALFGGRLVELGYELPDSAIFREAIRSKYLEDRPYAEFRRGDIGANNAFYRVCERHSRPMVTVATARRYATLEWDCLTIDAKHDSHTQGELGTELGRALFSRFQERARGAPGKPIFFGKAFVGSVKKLMPEIARDLADDFFAMLYSPVRESIGRQDAA